MTIPRGIHTATRKVSDMVRAMVPHMRQVLSKDEHQLAVYLRGNEVMFDALTGMIRTRIAGRASLPEPSDPLVCKSMLARDRELQWLLSRLEFVYKSPVSQTAEEDGEQPA